MGLFNLVLTVAAFILLEIISCEAKDGTHTIVSERKHSGVKFSPAVVGNGDSDKKQLLRSLTDSTESNEKQVEEARSINLSFLKNAKKNIPGLKALKAAAAARSAATQAKKAEKIKMTNLFKISGTSDRELFLKFNEWRAMKKTGVDAVEGVFKAMGKAGMTEKQAIAIGNRYDRWLSVFKVSA
ncbi:uncharacterized protein PITG_08322 [Phytophthora infestans T30-4]|uniref:RxLR effector protein n=1 Tax=Phytophthora infestans (strain T30-4) TaxID=403677 RepID=D0NAB5_PHYIT|nr:uncharacterized protein PITG_08322 [Phytophthora infestans T30-4]EEY54773.1 conserved hypothetical protein [Phytophthora infestans T30-4]|eukprot:XP_002903718.1 conserved hypothetical protein [Phytophthora infestans T30-4]